MDCRVKIDKCRIFGTVCILVEKSVSVENGCGIMDFGAEDKLVSKIEWQWIKNLWEWHDSEDVLTFSDIVRDSK